MGHSGLTISSGSSCLSISGSVTYAYTWGDWSTNRFLAPDLAADAETANSAMSLDDGLTVIGAGSANGESHDWRSRRETLLRVGSTSSSDFGTMQGVIELKSVEDWQSKNGGARTPGIDATGGSADNNGALVINQAYVSIGDTTVLSAGKKNTIAPRGDDEPFNFLGLINAMSPRPEVQGFGVYFRNYAGQTMPLGGDSVSIVSDFGNGWSAGAAVENLDAQTSYGGVAAGVDAAGTAIGFVAYRDQTVSAHATVFAGGVLDGIVENWGLHTGITGNFGPVRMRAALAADDTGYWNGLVSAEDRYDMFVLAASAEATSGDPDVSGDEEYGFGGSASTNFGDVLVNGGFRWFDTDASKPDTETYQIALQASMPVSEALRLSGEVGYYGGAASLTDGMVTVLGSGIADPYVGLGLTWSAGAPAFGAPPAAPGGGAAGPVGPPPGGGGFLLSTRGEFYTSGAFRTTFLLSKNFN
ncbi:MAG: hypothetical protein P4M09_26800 [Devosia sp.]|nr:hypothetical protein [Devosia sp.]